MRTTILASALLIADSVGCVRWYAATCAALLLLVLMVWDVAEANGTLTRKVGKDVGERYRG